uniref:Uncharacterized protein n=1 Tax=Solanum tuberosum TaxID=4113 RepID=M1DB12_SOLTU
MLPATPPPDAATTVRCRHDLSFPVAGQPNLPPPKRIPQLPLLLVIRIEIDNVLDVAYQNEVAIVHQQVYVEFETTLQHPHNILEEVSDDAIMNVEEEISENEENESFDDKEWDDNKNETTEEEEEWENYGIETSEDE